MLNTLTNLINLQGEDAVCDYFLDVFDHGTLLANSQCDEKIAQALVTCFLLSSKFLLSGEFFC